MCPTRKQAKAGIKGGKTTKILPNIQVYETPSAAEKAQTILYTRNKINTYSVEGKLKGGRELTAIVPDTKKDWERAHRLHSKQLRHK